MERRAFLAATAALPVAGVAAADLTTDTGDTTLRHLGDELDWAWAHEKALIDSETWGDTYEAAFNASSAVVSQIEQQQARTLEGFRVKARAAMWCQSWGKFEPFSLSERQTTDIRLAESIVLDLVGVAS